MAVLLVVHHTVSPATRAMLEAVLAGVHLARAEGVNVTAETRPALSASATDVLHADGILLGTPANIGYMSGAMKHFFDTVYYQLLGETRSLPCGAFVHGNEDLTGTLRAIASITAALGWRPVAGPVAVRGAPTADDLAACKDLGAATAATTAG